MTIDYDPYFNYFKTKYFYPGRFDYKANLNSKCSLLMTQYF